MDQLSLLKSIVSDISGILKSEDFLNAHRFPHCFVRKRKLSVYHVVTYLLYSTRQAMHNNISRIIKLRPVQFPDVTKQAVSKARQGIMPSLFRELFDISVDAFKNASLPGKLWRGKERVFAVDGSKIQLPDSKSNFESFGEMFSRENPEKRWSLALASLIYDVNNDYICHGLLRPYLSSERRAALDHCKSLESIGILKGAVIIFDRGYYSKAMFRYFSENGYKCVMRLKENLKLAKECKGDSLLSIEFEDAASGQLVSIPVRVLSIDLGNGTTEYLATNLFDKAYTAEDFKELYFMRWNLELKYNELKNQLLLEEFNGATSVSVEQEFYINLLYSNLASLTKSHADVEIEKAARPGNKFRYQANRAFIIGRLKDILVPILCGHEPDTGFDDLFRKACRNKSQVQPGRSSERKRIKRDRTHFNNRKTAV